MRQKLIWLAVVFGASFYVLAFFVGEETTVGQALGIKTIDVGLARSINVVATIALGLGIVNLFIVHGTNIWKRKAHWPMSVVVFLVFATVTAFLVWESRIAQHETDLRERTAPAIEAYQAAAAIDDPVERDRAFGEISAADMALVREYYAYQSEYHFKPRTFYLESIINPLAATVMALLGFYITYAAYRAFRIRSLEATVMMISATIMILGSDPVGGWLSMLVHQPFGYTDPKVVADSWFWLPTWADFDNRVMMSGMQRGLAMGISIATIAAATRMIMGLERGVMEARGGGD